MIKSWSLAAACLWLAILVAQAQDGPFALFIAPEEVCAPATVVLDNRSTGGILYTWYINGIQVQQTVTPQNLEHHFSNTGTATLQHAIRLVVRDGSGGEDIYEKNIRVFREINASFTASASSGCHPLEVDFTNTSSGHTGTWEWNFGDGGSSWVANPSHTYLNFFDAGSVTYTVTLTAISPDRCRDEATHEITVTPYQEALFTIDTVQGCHELEVTVTDLSTIWADEYRWDMGDGTPVRITGPSETISHNYVNNTGSTQVYTVTLTLERDGCADIMQREVTVFPEVTAGFVASPLSGCSPMEVAFQNNSTGSSGWLWEFGDGSGSTGVSPVHVYLNEGDTETVYRARLIALTDNICSDTTGYTDITVSPHVSAAFDIDTAEGCHPLTVTFRNRSTGNDSHFWSFGDGTPEQPVAEETFTRTFENTTTDPITYTIGLTAENSHGCVHTVERSVTVYPAVTADFTTDPGEGCSPLEVQFINNSTGGSFFLWEFGDGGTSDEASPMHVYEKNTGDAARIYHARLIAISGELCRDTTGYREITVFPHILAGFTIDNHEGCHPMQVTVTDNSEGTGLYQWDMGDGTLYAHEGGSFTHTYTNTGDDILEFNIQLRLTGSHGCTDEYQAGVRVHPELIAGFTADIQSGCGPLEVSFTNASINADSFLWDFGDGATSTLENPQHTFYNHRTADTVYLVRLTVFSAGGECTGESEMAITVHGKVEAGFSMAEVSGCTPLTAEFFNLSVGGETFRWDFGDGSEPQVSDAYDGPVHQFHNTSCSVPAEYDVSLEVFNSDGCSDIFMRTVVVHPVINAVFSASATTGCHPFTVSLSAEECLGAAYYHWDFGDGNTSSELMPVHTFTNTGEEDSIYTVRLVTTSANYHCSDTFSMEITVHPVVTAGFNFTGSPGCTPLTLTIGNSSVNGAEFYWDLGNGHDTVTFNKDAFLYTFENSNHLSPAFYTVTLRAVSSSGCENEISRKVEVHSSIEAGFSADITQGCHPLTVEFTNSSLGASGFSWDFGDGSSSGEASPVHTFTNMGTADTVYRVTLLATAPNGICSDSFAMEIRVHPFIRASFDIPLNTACSPAEFTFTNSSVGGEIFRWDFGDGNDTTTVNTDPFSRWFFNSDHTGPAGFRVVLEAENFAGCTHTTERTLSLYPAVRAVVEPSVSEGCHPLHVTFSNGSAGGYTYHWDFGDGASTDRVSPSHTFTNFTNNPVTREVSFRATSEDFCTSDTSFLITVHPLPYPFIDIDRPVSCPPFDLEIGNLTMGAESYTWLFGDGTSLNTTGRENFTHRYNNTGPETEAFELRLVARTDYGCIDSAQQNIYVYPGVITSFSSETEGCSPLTVRFTDGSSGAVTHRWDFGDGNMSLLKEPTHQYFNHSVNDTSYYVVQVGISEHGCTDTMGYYIDVFPQPTSWFSVTPYHQVWPSARIDLVNLTNPGHWDFEWDFGDGSTSSEKEPLYHEYTHWGNYQVTLVAESPNCSHSITRSIRVLAPPPVASIGDVAGDCAPYGVQFVNNSVYGTSYHWDFGDGNISTEAEPYHVFAEAGLYNVKLTVTGDGGDEFAYMEVEVFNIPVVDFEVAPSLVMLPGQQVQLFNRSLHGNTWLWEFGDGGVSDDENPLYLYGSQGFYDIRLGVWSVEGCYAEKVKFAAVQVEGEAVLRFPNAFRPDISGPSGGRYDSNAANPNTIFYPLHSGVEKYRLEIYNRWGELLFISDDVETGWDGYYQGSLSKQDVYIWKVMGAFLNGVTFEQAGNVTLLR